MPMRLLVTRPQPQADAWVARLGAMGVDAMALPLIEIAAPADPAAVASAWAALAAIDLAIFVSPNAAARFFDARPADLTWPATTLAAAPGPGTASALEGLGIARQAIVEPPADSAQFDSDSLWPVLAARRDWRGARVLVVRGDGGRDALGAQLRSHGARVEHVAAYRRCAPAFDGVAAATLDAALHEPLRHAWLFSSSQAIDHLVAARPQAAAHRSFATAIATHPRIAERARAAGFRAVFECAPTLAAVVGCLQSIATATAP